MKVRILSILLFAVNLGFGQIYIDSYRFAAAQALTVEYLVVGGGGGGGVGGGGAGGFREGNLTSPLTGTNYQVTVGSGGAANLSGGNSVFSSITAAGGGFGGDISGPNATTNSDGGNGGSGGGSGTNISGTAVGTPGNGNTPSVSPSQGNNGGFGTISGGFAKGGGGGAGAVGDNAVTTTGGNGGIGKTSSITGGSVYYAGGGGGSASNTAGAIGGSGGLGGGGNGGSGSNGSGSNGTANTGGGGGGRTGGTGVAGSGGSGVVILRYPSGYTITNPGGGLTFTTTTVGSDKVTTFTSGTGNIQFEENFNLLLDDYPGAAVAYSLRKLDKDYTGSAIQIRTTGTGTNQPAGALANIGFDSNGDLDETAIINHCLGTSCTVQTWYDQSGNGNNATQTTPANQPTIYTGGAVVVDGSKPALLFDNTNDLMLTSNFTSLSNSTYFIVSKLNAGSGSGDYSYIFSTLATPRQTIAKWNNFDIEANKRYIYPLSTAIYDDFNTLQKELLYLQHPSTSPFISMYVNNVNKTFSSNPTGAINPTNTIIYLGALYIAPNFYHPMDGYFSEFIVYASDQSSNRTSIQSNINSYYSIY